MADLQNLTHPIAVFIRGLPGSGKSYLATRVQAAISEGAAVLIDPDAVDQNSDEYKQHVRVQEAEGVDPKLHLYRFSRDRAYRAIEAHKIIIWNQPFTNLEIFQKMVGRLQDHASASGTTLPMLVVEVQIDPALAKERVASRKAAGGHGPSDDTFARFVREYSGASTDTYDILRFDGTAEADESVERILARLESMLT